MPLLPTSGDMSVAQLCSFISDCTALPFDREQHRSLQAQLGEQIASLDDRQFDRYKIDLNYAHNQLKLWANAHLIAQAKSMEARYA